MKTKHKHKWIPVGLNYIPVPDSEPLHMIAWICKCGISKYTFSDHQGLVSK